MENYAQLTIDVLERARYRRSTSLYKATGSKPLGAATLYLIQEKHSCSI